MIVSGDRRYARGKLFQDMQRDTNYSFKLRAISSAGSSEWSNTLNTSTTAGQAPDVPTAPYSVYSSIINNATQLNIGWQVPNGYGLVVSKYAAISTY